MNYDIISHFKNTSFNLDKVDMENQIKMLENIVNTYQTDGDEWTCGINQAPLYTTVEPKDTNPILMTFNQSMITNQRAEILTERGRQNSRQETSTE